MRCRGFTGKWKKDPGSSPTDTKKFYNIEKSGGPLNIVEEKDKEARAFLSLRKFEEALKTFNEIYDIQKSRYRLEPEHPQILSAQNNIATVLISMRKYDEALKILTEIDEKIKIKNPGRRFSVVSQHTRAVLYLDEGKYQEAFQIFRKILVILKKEYGLNHSNTLAAQTNLAALLHIFGKNVAALYIYKSVFERKIASLGPEHPSTLHTQRSVVSMLAKTGKYNDAINMANDVYKQRCNTLGPDHPITLGIAEYIQKLKNMASKQNE